MGKIFRVFLNTVRISTISCAVKMAVKWTAEISVAVMSVACRLNSAVALSKCHKDTTELWWPSVTVHRLNAIYGAREKLVCDDEISSNRRRRRHPARSPLQLSAVSQSLGLPGHPPTRRPSYNAVASILVPFTHPIHPCPCVSAAVS